MFPFSPRARWLIAILGWIVQAASAQGTNPGLAVGTGGIYACTDAHGRHLTSDRPIADCIDREQRELNPSGTVRRRVEAVLTARQLTEREEMQRASEFMASRQLEERRRERALLMRYPNAAVHDQERLAALAQIDQLLDTARGRLANLAQERLKIDSDLEFYRASPAKAPPALRRQQDDNVKNVAIQGRLINDQEDEKKRITARFDDEQSRLKDLWPTTLAR